MGGFRRLSVWQKSYELTLEIYRHTMDFPSTEKYGITSQLRRAAYSVPTNISEGYERNHRKEYIQFLHIAKGSLGEMETFLLLSRDLGYMNEMVFMELEGKRTEIVKMLTGLVTSLTDRS